MTYGDSEHVTRHKPRDLSEYVHRDPVDGIKPRGVDPMKNLLVSLRVSDLPWTVDEEARCATLAVAPGEWIDLNWKKRWAFHYTDGGEDFVWGAKDCRPRQGDWESLVRQSCDEYRAKHSALNPEVLAELKRLCLDDLPWEWEPGDEEGYTSAFLEFWEYRLEASAGEDDVFLDVRRRHKRPGGGAVLESHCASDLTAEVAFCLPVIQHARARYAPPEQKAPDPVPTPQEILARMTTANLSWSKEQLSRHLETLPGFTIGGSGGVRSLSPDPGVTRGGWSD